MATTADLILNPTIELELRVTLRVRDAGLVTKHIPLSASSSGTFGLGATVLDLIRTPRCDWPTEQLAPATVADLIRAGVLVRADQVASGARPRLKAVTITTPDVDRSTSGLPSAEAPIQVPGENIEGNYSWVPDPLTGSEYPVDHRIAAEAPTRAARDPSPTAGGGTEIAKLFSPRRRNDRARYLASAQSHLRNYSFCVLRDLIPQEVVEELGAYLEELHAEGFYRPCDPQVPLRDTIHNEPFCRHLHAQLSPFISAVCEAAIKPSYSFLAFYRPGATLDRHLDREQCAWNLSIPLWSNLELDRASSWPIFLEVDGVPNEVRLGLGDGVLYSGTKTPHWRPAQPSGQSCIVCFFHFVPSHMSGPLE